MRASLLHVILIAHSSVIHPKMYKTPHVLTFPLAFLSLAFSLSFSLSLPTTHSTRKKPAAMTVLANQPKLPWHIRLQIPFIHLFYTVFLRPNHTVNRRVINFIVRRTPPSPTTPVNDLITYDLTIDPNLPLTLRVFSPHSHRNKKLPLIIFLHGGGFFIQTADSSACHSFAASLSLHLPAIVASLSYRLSPEHKYPAQHDDVRHMLRFLNSHPHLLPPNTDLSNTFLAGESAGANLAHFATSHFSTLHSLALKGLISVQPFFGGERRTPSEIRQFDGPMIPVPVTDWMWRAYLPPGADIP